MSSSTIILHGLGSCDTCRAARRRLEATGRTVVLRDLRLQAPDAAEVARWHDALGPELLNRRSATWRRLEEADRAGDPEALMVAHPTLIKRPVVEADERLHLGWTEATRTALGL
ncbi:ArsC/Spx/MgsR family protein [uncultured Jannaschia sp.]|uniref:arsenate reductase family protein n=1 Tax=uncultured Jannaschia sp. TaxID=293347 RepID=UPI002626955D|nr:ArsC/Spx/MgsR family protein [uncultured Jannaschia sp.]